MPSYHPRESNPSMVFILGGDENEDENEDEDDYIIINKNMNMYTNIIPDSSSDTYELTSYQFINNLVLFIKTIFIF